MNNQQFDDHIRQQFSNYTPDVHPRIWENIVAEKERKRPVGLWVSLFNNRNRLLLLGLLITVSTAGTLLYVNDGFTFSNKKSTGDQVLKTESKNDPGNNGSADNNNKNELPDNSNTVSSSADAPVLNKENNEATDNSSGNNNNPQLTSGGTKIQVYAPALADDEQKSFTNNKTAKKKRSTGFGSVLNVTTESPDPPEDDLTGLGSLLARLTFDAERISADRKRKKHPLYLKRVTYLPDCPTIERNAAGNKKYLEIYAGPDYAFRTLTDTGNSVYLQKRKESAKFRSAFSAGIRYTRVFNNSMSVRGGINYSQINEKFTFKQGGVIQIIYIIDVNGDTTGTYVTSGTRYKTTHNKYRSIDIPVTVGYEVGNGKLHANINAGIVVNLYSWQKGEVLDNNLNPVDITTGKGSSPYQFKTNAGVGFIGAVSVYYKLNDRLHIMAEPYFRYNFTPLNKESITLKQKYNTAGLRLGIRLDLK